jgi:hypothetical protein
MTELFVGPELNEEQKQERYSRPIMAVTLSDLLPRCPHYAEIGSAHLCVACKELMCDACAAIHVHFNGLNKGEPNRWVRDAPH